MLVIKDLNKKYDDIVIMKNLNYKFDKGKKYILFGPSGCGKTTLLRIIAGLENMDEGEIYMDNKLIGSKSFQLNIQDRKTGIVFQKPTLWEHLKIAENIGFGLYDLAKKNREIKVNSIMVDLEIEHLANKYPAQISGGEAKRVALARMLVRKWEYLLLDEPLSNIDNNLKSKIISIINKYAKENDTMLIYVTHDEKEAEKIGDEIIKMKID